MSAAPFRRSVVITRVLIPAIAALSTGCGSDGGGRTTGPAPTGSLTMTVVATDSFAGTVHISGPSGYTHSVTSTTTLIGIPVGSYTASADSSASVPDSIVGATLFNAVVTGSPAIVARGDTARISATYALEHRGALWVTNIDSSMIEDYGVEQLRRSATIASPTQANGLAAGGVAFDASGNMWVSGVHDHTLHMYSVANRIKSGKLTPTLTMSSTSLGTGGQMAFDPGGTLWIADSDSGLVGFTASQLSAGASGIAGAYVVRDTVAAPPRMVSVTFDASGDAWVAEGEANAVVEFSPAQLAASGAHVPVVRLDRWFSTPTSLAFDGHGNLWVSNISGLDAEMFTPLQLASADNSEPTIKIFTDFPSSLMFDNSGSLWITDRYNPVIYRFSPTQLLVTTRPDPADSAVINGNVATQIGTIAFDPWVAAPTTTGSSVLPSRSR
jgi:streptogramin lyase